MTFDPIIPPDATALTPAICAILAERQRQAEALGRDDGHDDALPVNQLSRRAQQRMTDAHDRISAARSDQDWHNARVALVKAAALAVATLDRLDRAHPAAMQPESPASPARALSPETIDRIWEERGWRD